MFSLPPRTARASSLAFLLAANAAPLVGVLLLGWSPVTTVLAYFAETAVVGVYAMLRILLSRGDEEGRVATAVMFAGHYGFVLALQAWLFLSYSQGLDAPRLVGTGADLHVVHGMAPQPVDWASLSPTTAAFAASHGWSFVVHYLGRERQETVPREEAVRPYRRIFAQYLFIVAGCMLVLELHLAGGWLVGFVLAKTLLDARLHLQAHRDGTVAATS